MPNYSNPYMNAGYSNMFPNWNGLQQPMVMAPVQQTMSATPTPAQVKSMEWVEGEIGAKAFQMPVGWPANTPIALWDSTDTVIYLKSVNQMGVPNPMQKLKYTIEEQPNQRLISGTAAPVEAPDMSQYVTKSDLEQMKQELRQAMSANQNASKRDNREVQQNRGGNT